jgi:uncharacterized membrane protein YdbT with pleckstrin-like domain
MRYITSTLPSNETIIKEIKFHWSHSLLSWFYLIFLGIFLIGIYLFIKSLIERYATERAITEHRIILKTGLISRNTEEIRLDRIEELNLHQTILGRLIGTGDLHITGTGGSSLHMHWLADPIGIQKIINAYRMTDFDD